MVIECVVCGADIEMEQRLSIGDVLDCPECATRLLLVDTDPFTVEVDEDEETPDGERSEAGLLDEDENWAR